MKEKTEEFLYFALWAGSMLMRPTFRNLTDSFESWAYRHGVLRQIRRLEQRKWIETRTSTTGDRLYRLTAPGRLHALGGRDPEACWKRQWDGRWRMVVYDVPEVESRARHRLRRYLRGHRFGCLQNSVWISPHPLEEQRTILAEGPVNVEALLLLEARPCAGESDDAIVNGAWDFATITQAYHCYQTVLARHPKHPVDSEDAAKHFCQWLREERRAWRNAVRRDPLLPEPLLPKNYVGREAWKCRCQVMAQAAEQMRAFRSRQGGRSKTMR